MKLISSCLLVLVCIGLATSKLSPVHYQEDADVDYAWLDPSIISEIEQGTLTVISHQDPAEIDSYISPVDQRVIHIWSDPETGENRYLIKDYTVAGQAADAENEANHIVDLGTPEEQPVAEPTPVRVTEPTPVPVPEPVTEPVPEEPSVPEPPKEQTVVAPPTEPELTAPIEPTPTPVPAPAPEPSSSETSSFKCDYPVTIIKDEKIVTICKDDPETYDNSLVLHKVRLWDSIEALSATQVALKFGEVEGQDLSIDDYTLLNALVTGKDKPWFQYNYWRVKQDQLEHGLRAIFMDMKNSVNYRDIVYAAKEIRECKKGYVAFSIDNGQVDMSNANGWSVHAEMFVATCSPDSHKVEFFAWSGMKHGKYAANTFSITNSETVAKLIKRWLFSHIKYLITCKDGDQEEQGIWSNPQIRLRNKNQHSQAVSAGSAFYSRVESGGF